MNLKEAADKASIANHNKRKKDIQKEEGDNSSGTVGCLLFLTLFITGIVLGVKHVNATDELYKAKWFFYFSFGAGSFIGSIILSSIIGSIFPIFKSNVHRGDVQDSNILSEDEIQKENILKAMGAGKEQFKDGEWLFALALDSTVTVSDEFFINGISRYNENFSNVECSGFGAEIWSIEFDDCHCHLTFMPSAMPENFYASAFPHCMFPKGERERFLKHEAFVNFTFNSKKKNPKVRYLQAFALISCFQDSLSGILNSTAIGLSSPQILNVVKETKLGPLQPLCQTYLHELKRPDGFSWYVSRGNALFGIPDFATLAPTGKASEVAVMLNGILNLIVEKKLDTSIGSVIEVSESLKLKTSELYEYEDYIKLCDHDVFVLAEYNQELPKASSETKLGTINHDKGTPLEEVNKKMIEWISHPAEFCEAPTEIRVLRKINCQWPGFEDNIDLFFHEFKMESGKEYVGISGPIEWAFRGSNLKEFSEDEQQWIFAGWFMTWLIDSGHMEGKEPDSSNDELALSLVRNFEGVNSTEITSRLDCQGGHLFYAVKLIRDSGDKFVLFELSNITGGFLELNTKSWEGNELDPLYYCIGKTLFKGGVDLKEE